ncbi:hypothetical protein TNCV_4238081 [Trichonephila clavipes]|nr:hypothetical protein TNCV_4238081 [Trichonephila clavipes]
MASPQEQRQVVAWFIKLKSATHIQRNGAPSHWSEEVRNSSLGEMGGKRKSNGVIFQTSRHNTFGLLHSRHRRTKSCLTHSKKFGSRSDNDPCRGIIHCSIRHLIHKQLQEFLEEEIQEIEVREAWRPSNRSATFNPPNGICSMEVELKNVLVHHHTRTTRSGVQWPVLPVATPGEEGTLQTCKFLQPYHGAPNPCIHLVTPLV